MLARIRLKVPDRPGSLGRVASAIGTASGDIAGVDVLDSEAGQAQDDVVVQVRDIPHLSRVLDGLAAVPGVEVVGVHHPEPPVTGHADLQLVAQVVARPDRSLQTPVDGAPTALGVDWAAIVHAADAVLSLPDALPDTLPASLPASLPAGILAGRDDAGLRVVATSPEAPGGTPVIIGPLRLRTLQVPCRSGCRMRVRSSRSRAARWACSWPGRGWSSTAGSSGASASSVPSSVRAWPCRRPPDGVHTRLTASTPA